MENVEILKENCKEYAKTKKSVDVLRKANGKNHYTEIAKIIGIHNTAASGLLKKAEKLGLAKRIKSGIYKKIPGILGFMPRGSNPENNIPRTLKDLSQRVVKKRNIPKTKFPASLIIQPRIIVSLDKMVMAYQFLYAVENSLRELVRAAFGSEKDWWERYVSSDVQKKVQKNINEMPYHAAIRSDELEYTHLGQLKEIIYQNWNFFLPYLKEKDRNNFSATINKAIASRNAIGHCIPLKSEDLKIVDVRLQDILEMIK